MPRMPCAALGRQLTDKNARANLTFHIADLAQDAGWPGATAGITAVILTSSTVAMVDETVTGLQTDANWRNLNAPGTSAYAGSKTLAERAAWDRTKDPWAACVPYQTGGQGRNWAWALFWWRMRCPKHPAQDACYVPPREGRASPKRGCSFPAMPQASAMPAAQAAKMAGKGATSSTANATPGVKMPLTSRKLE